MADEHRLQITTDGFVFYHKGVEEVFAGQADFAQMIKIYGDYGQHDTAGRYSPAPMIETIIKIRDGRPDPRHISYQLCREAEPHDSHGNPPLHAVDECVFKETGQSQIRLRVALRLLQFLPDTQDPSRDASDGSGHHQPRLESQRIIELDRFQNSIHRVFVAVQRFVINLRSRIVDFVMTGGDAVKRPSRGASRQSPQNDYPARPES